jgi:hypothetical protein
MTEAGELKVCNFIKNIFIIGVSHRLRNVLQNSFEVSLVRQMFVGFLLAGAGGAAVKGPFDVAVCDVRRALRKEKLFRVEVVHALGGVEGSVARFLVAALDILARFQDFERMLLHLGRHKILNLAQRLCVADFILLRQCARHLRHAVGVALQIFIALGEHSFLHS